MITRRSRLHVEHEMWDQAQTQARAFLARIDRGETTAPEPVIRYLRIFTAPDTTPQETT